MSAARPGLLEGLEDSPHLHRPGADSPPPSPPLPPPSYSILGGPTSIHANLEELEQASILLATVSADLTGLGGRAAGWGGLLALATAQSPAARALAGKTAELSTGLVSLGAATAVQRELVVRSVEAYRTAEEAARQGFAALTKEAGFILTLGLLAADQRVPTVVGEAAVNAVAGPLPASVGLYPMATVAGRHLGQLDIGPVRAAEPVRRAEEWGESWTPEDAGALTAYFDHLNVARQAEPGSIHVTRVDQPGGEVTWMVSIPGTQDGDVDDGTGWSTNPWDLSGLGESLAHGSKYTGAAVLQALQDAGAEPGDGLALNGYSQGGIHATRMANDERFREYFEVQGLLTVGSPTAGLPVPPDVPTVHMEHVDDAPAAADGGLNPEGVNRGTVRVSGYHVAPEEGEGLLGSRGATLMAGHNWDNYRAHAEVVEQDPDAAEDAPAIDHLGALAAAGGASAVIRLERQRPEPSRNPSESRAHPESPDRRGGTPRRAIPGPYWKPMP